MNDVGNKVVALAAVAKCRLLIILLATKKPHDKWPFHCVDYLHFPAILFSTFVLNFASFTLALSELEETLLW